MARKQAADGTESSQQLVEGIFRTSLRYLKDEIEGIASGKVKIKGHDPASRIAWLAKQVSSVGAEQRKAAAAEQKRIDAIDRATFITWARGLTPDKRAALIRELVAMDDGRSVLG